MPQIRNPTYWSPFSHKAHFPEHLVAFLKRPYVLAAFYYNSKNATYPSPFQAISKKRQYFRRFNSILPIFTCESHFGLSTP